MPKFSNRSLARLRTCHPILQELCQRVVEHHDISIITGHRTQQQQDEARHNNSQKSWPNSKHNTTPSMAVDIAPYPLPESWGSLSGATTMLARDLAWKERVKFYEALAVFRFCWAQMITDFPEIADQCRLRLGADWDGDHDYRDQTFDDLGHIELTSVHLGKPKEPKQ